MLTGREVARAMFIGSLMTLTLLALLAVVDVLL